MNEQDLNSIEVLLIEDNEFDAELTIKTFIKNNLAKHLLWIKDGSEAIDFISGKGKYSSRDLCYNPSLILLDLKLPKVSGLEILDKIKNDRETKRVPVVVLSSSTLDDDIIKSYDLGVNSFIVKPIDFHEFVDSIKEIGIYWMLNNQWCNSKL